LVRNSNATEDGNALRVRTSLHGAEAGGGAADGAADGTEAGAAGGAEGDAAGDTFSALVRNSNATEDGNALRVRTSRHGAERVSVASSSISMGDASDCAATASSLV
jgi:hypothetical protein